MPLLLNSAIELHDSTLGKIERAGNKVVLWLTPAYVHKSDGEPGVDPGTGWIQETKITIESCTAIGTIQELPMDLDSGTLTIDGAEFPNIIPLPLVGSAAVRLSLLTQANERIELAGSAIEVEPLGRAEYLEFGPGR